MSESGTLPIEYEQFKALSTINILDDVLGITPDIKQPYLCESYRANPELNSLEHNLFRDSFYQMESESGVKIHAYAREIGYSDASYLEILTEDEWLKLPERPIRIDEIKEEIRKAEDREFLVGIKHIRPHNRYHLVDIMKKIPVPELEFKEPL